MPTTMNSIASRALLLSATILLMGVVLAVVVTAACGNDNGSVEPEGTGVISTEDAIFVTSGELDDLRISAAQVADEIVVTGSKWTAIGPVRFYLLTKEQLDQVLFDQRHAVTLGDVTPEEDGAVSLRFRLASSYETASGERVQIEAGQQWYVAAFQSTGRGSHGTGVGPLTVK